MARKRARMDQISVDAQLRAGEPTEEARAEHRRKAERMLAKATSSPGQTISRRRTMTKTEANAHRAARPPELARTMASFIFPREPKAMIPRVHTSHGVLTMQLFVDLKICESCGSLWYRPTGGATVYCSGCSVKLREFPSPRQRLRPGGRRKRRIEAAVVALPMAGAR